MENLEPIYYQRGEILSRELKDHESLHFLMNGQFWMGYSINNNPIFRLKRYNSIIGIFGITFNQKSHYICQVAQSSDGFFMRACHWHSCLEEAESDPEFYSDLRSFIKSQYQNKVNKLLHKMKEQDTKKLLRGANTANGLIYLNVPQREENLTPS